MRSYTEQVVEQEDQYLELVTPTIPASKYTHPKASRINPIFRVGDSTCSAPASQIGRQLITESMNFVPNHSTIRSHKVLIYRSLKCPRPVISVTASLIPLTISLTYPL